MSLKIFKKTRRAMIEGLGVFVSSLYLWLLSHRFKLVPQLQVFESSSDTRGF